MTREYYVNPHIKKTERVFPTQDRAAYLRLDMNENPEGLPEAFVSETRKSITPEFLSWYPEPEAFRKKYAAFVGAETQNIFVANGTDMVIRYALETFGEPGKDVLTVTPSFEMYRINCSLLGLCHKTVPYEDDFSLDVNKIVAAIDGDTRIVVLVNPNNPIGNTYSEEEFSAILKKAKEVGAVVIVDEAYHYFSESTFLPEALRNENVIVTRTFSKLFSIPALRLGVAIGNPKLIHYLRNGQLSFDVNAAALLFGEAMLDHPEMIKELIETEREGKAYLCAELDKAGYSYIRCEGNYVLIKTKNAPRDVEERLFQKKILIHSYHNPVLQDYIRVTTASARVMERFLSAFLEADSD